ncbi:conserved protein of unknown function (plasmid) [Rhodovastum atsumiense]|uniref:Uncharacterized protein n=1 Tax=Rhodovastum atsumiense TaxID=504468 RepID=A0A5M6ITD5_9PROT|nr:hypothetical protein [Rhodovastum atsumiense]KAA5611576.1 hypothetical protein F1189_13510 [Rhodovastum atsumiense]CAH2606341.1 conserved protein of unknown function [Rhodovastum atsumiense]
MVVRCDSPGIEIRLIKLVGVANGVAYRWQTANAEFNITSMLGDAGVVRTTKSLLDPCGGFSISFADREDPAGLDTLYGLIEPMDMIEIRMAREPWRYAGGTLPLVMRGFVSELRRSETLAGEEGKPQRAVIITGQDMGKLWQIHQLLPETIYASETSPYLDTYRLQAATGIEVAYLPVFDFMQQLVEIVMNEKVEQLSAFASAYVPPFRLVGPRVPEGIVSCSLVAPFTGPFWRLAELVADRPWNELFVEDTEEGPDLVFRPAPLKHVYGGGFIMEGAEDPGLIARTEEDVVSWDAKRSDYRVSNFYWVPPGSSMLDTSVQANVASLQNGDLQDFDYPNSAQALFGQRKMTVETRLLPNDVTDTPIRFNGQRRIEEGNKVIEWHRHRAIELKEMNRDNSALEEVTAVMKGHEEYKIGRYFQLTRGTIVSEAYITRVSHIFRPLKLFETALTLERGTGFLMRDQAARPYWQEGREGPYSR